MYLFVYGDGRVRQVHDNLTVTDMLALKQGELKVFTCADNEFYQIVIDESKVCKVPVQESNILKVETERLHHP
jgi:hypothetical protein